VRVILDTNVFVSGVFFGGIPARILEAWRDGRIHPVLSAEILDEYRRVGATLGKRYPGVDLEPLLAILAVHAEVVEAPALAEPVSVDPDDDKFLACAVAAGVTVIVSGDKHLVDESGWQGVRVLRPREFAEEFLVEA
jgi:uncharacterized protein